VGFYFRESPPRLHVAFAMKAIVISAVLTAVTGYCVAAGVIYATWSRSPHNRVSYFDLLLPTRWQEARALRGGDLVAEGLGELNRARYATALLLLSKGVAVSPAEQRGRLELAKMFMRLGYMHRARQLLEEGLAYPPITKGYAEIYFSLANHMEDHEAVLAAVQRLDPTANPPQRRELIGYRAQALLALRRFEELDAMRESMRAAPLVSVEIAWARSTIVRGRPDLALAALTADPVLFGLTDERRELEAEAALAARDLGHARRVLGEWLAERPTAPQPRRLEVVIAAKSGSAATLRAALERYFTFFGSNPIELAQLFVRLDAAGEWNAVELGRSLAEGSGAFPPLARMAYVEALLKRGEFAAANEALAATLKAMASARFAAGTWPEGMRRILDACTTPVVTTQAQLVDFLTNERASPAGFLLALDALAQSRAPEALRDVYALAKSRYPGLTPRPETWTRIAALTAPRESRWSAAMTESPAKAAAAAERRAEARREVAAQQKAKAPEVPRKELPPPLTERAAKALLVRVREQLDAGRPAEALAALEPLARPELAAFNKEVLLLRVQGHAALRSYDALRSTMWLVLRERPVNLPELRRIVEFCRARGLNDSALIITREIIATVPEAKWAAELRREIESGLKSEPAPPER
jgi:hypothetical protein